MGIGVSYIHTADEHLATIFEVKFEILFASFFTVLRFINTQTWLTADRERLEKEPNAKVYIMRIRVMCTAGGAHSYRGAYDIFLARDKSLNLVYKQILQYVVHIYEI